MKIVREFTPFSRFRRSHNIERKQYRIGGTLIPYLGVVTGEKEGELFTPLIYPQMATRYLDFALEYEVECSAVESVALATIVPPSEYMFYQDGKWSDTDEPVFQPPSVIAQGIQQWDGPVQFHIKFSQYARLEKIQLEYEVPLQLADYLVSFALPWTLRQIKVELSRQLYTEFDGTIPFSEGFDLSLVRTVWVKEEGCPLQRGVLDEESRTVTVSTPIDGDTPVQLIFETSFNAAKRGSDEAQLEHLPNVFINKRDFTQSRRIMPDDKLDPTHVFNLPVELSISAIKGEDASAIALAILDRFEKDGRLHVPAFDLEFGIQVIGAPKVGAAGGFIPEQLASMHLDLLIRNLAV